MLSKYKSAAIFISAAALFACILAVNSGCGKAGGSLDVFSVVEEPVFSPSAGTYSSSQMVSISSRTPGATIYYTTDDSEPKETSTKYTGSISVDATTKIRAKAYLSPKVPSAATSAIYEITGTVATPTFSPEAGSYANTQNVTIECLTGGARITYTTDGTTPVESSTLYENPLPVSANTTIKAKAFLSDYASSEVATAAYYIGQESAPVFTPSSGTYEGTTEKEITLTGSSGSTIYYTTDGSDPTLSSSSAVSPAQITITLDPSSPVKRQTIKAFSLQSGKVASPITSEMYTLSVTAEVLIADSGNVGKYTSISLDKLYDPHISYFDQTNKKVKHIYYNGSTFSTSDVASALGAGGGYSSIAVSSSDRVHISYYDETSGALKHAYSDAWAVWTTESVDTGGTGAFTSISLDPSGKPFISYYDLTNKIVKCASFESGVNWPVETISGSALSNDNYGRSAVAVDSSGKVYVLSHGNGEIISKVKAPLGNFTEEVIATYSSAGFYLDIALGSGSGSGINAYAVFCTPDLKFSRSYDSGTSWISPSSISSSTQLQHLSLAVDKRGGSDILHISAYDAASQTLKYFTNSSGNWEEYCIDDSLKVGSYSSIAVDDNGYFHISYYDESGGNLKYATNKP